MSKVCVNKDELLLMLAHGQLGFLDRVRLRWHVKSCPKCQARLARYSSLSGALATVMASPTGPRWISGPATRLVISRGAFLAGVVLILMLSFVSLRGSAEATVTPEVAPNLRLHCEPEPTQQVAKKACFPKKPTCAPTNASAIATKR